MKLTLQRVALMASLAVFCVASMPVATWAAGPGTIRSATSSTACGGARHRRARKARPGQAPRSAKHARVAPAKARTPGRRLNVVLKHRRRALVVKSKRVAARLTARTRAISKAIKKSFVLEAPRLTWQALRNHPKDFIHGVVVDGPRHTMHAIAKNKGVFIGGLLTVSALGGAAHAFGVKLEPFMLSLSFGALSVQARATVRKLDSLRLTGPLRARFLGAELGFPAALVGASSLAGVSIGGGHAESSSAMSRFAAGAAANGLIGGDGPAVLSNAIALEKERASEAVPHTP